MLTTPAGAQAPAPADSFATVARFLATPRLADRAVRVDSLVLEVGRGRVRLGPGVLLALSPIAGRTHAAVFVGPSRIEYLPESAVECEEVRRFAGRPVYGRGCDTAVIVACDGTLDEALRTRPAVDIGIAQLPTTASPGAAVTLRDFAKLLEGGRGDAWPGLVRGLLHGAEDGYRLVVGSFLGRPAAALEFDPAEREASALYARSARADEALVLVSREAVPGAATGSFPGRRPSLVPERVVVDATIEDNLAARVMTVVQARMHEAGPAWIPFALSTDVVADSVTLDGAAVPFGRLPDSHALWVRVPAGVDRGMAGDLRFVTHGRMLARDGDWIALKSSLGWLPVHDHAQRTPYELTFHSPRAYRLVSVGDLAASSTMNDRTVTRWVLPWPARNPTFVIGPFEETKLDDPRLPPLTVLMSKSMQKQVRATYGEGEVGGDLSKQAVADLANAQNFYRTLFGDPPDTTVVAAEISYLHGEAFPGLVNLTWATFSDVAADRSLPTHMRAHEMAHQWWPLGADFATYRDQWLSEGMADFCALWFQQAAAGNTRAYFERLDAWKRDLVPRRWRTAGNPEEASPLALGWRIRSEKGRGAREAVLYHKGAWVLHMLRGLMLDPRTLRDERFAAFLRETYRTYRGRSMSTQDVEAMAAKHAGEDLGWFFSQWVEGTAIPGYRWAWRKERQADGRWNAEVRVRASETPADFRMPVRVRLDLGEGRSVRFRVDVTGAGGTSSVEGIEFEPRSLEFNEFASVLCEAKEEPW